MASQEAGEIAGAVFEEHASRSHSNEFRAESSCAIPNMKENDTKGTLDDGTVTKDDSKGVVCKVPRCLARLEEEREFNQRHRLCSAHQRALELDMPGGKKRFCQQCNRLHPLDAFDGEKRGCRARLERHNRRRRVRKHKARTGEESKLKGEDKDPVNVGLEDSSKRRKTDSATHAGVGDRIPTIQDSRGEPTASRAFESFRSSDVSGLKRCVESEYRESKEAHSSITSNESLINESAFPFQAIGAPAYGAFPRSPLPRHSSTIGLTREPYINHFAAASAGRIPEYMRNTEIMARCYWNAPGMQRACRASDMQRFFENSRLLETLDSFRPWTNSEGNSEAMTTDAPYLARVHNATTTSHLPFLQVPSSMGLGGNPLMPEYYTQATRQQMIAWISGMRF